MLLPSIHEPADRFPGSARGPEGDGRISGFYPGREMVDVAVERGEDT
jgi:hypothetical protein